MPINLEGLSAKELQALIAKANQRKKTLAKRKPVAAVRKKLVSLAKAEGYSVDELFGTGRMVREKAGVDAAAKKAPAKKSAQKGSKVEPKYRNPANGAETWAGRGMPPKWLSAELAKGSKLEDFLIRK
ncbi:H-NS family nucleoid-associated regulatory protein [Arenimonas sp. MALMAid1274]|uniref:H-NS histone family protein n=1 Tax=Arenimonas sp. MALMAid1274 TaxID=3411630 RepID=UPI003BA012B7